MGQDIVFLSFEELEQIHVEQLKLYGGSAGLVDENVVRSSLDAPRWTHRYGGDVSACAAAYLYHFARNQGFADGNKRTALNAADVFLRRNGYRLPVPTRELYEFSIRVAVGQVDKEAAAQWIRDRIE